MRIHSTNILYNPSFEQINLSQKDIKTSDKLFSRLAKSDNPKRDAMLTSAIYDFYYPHLANEVDEKKTSTTAPHKDFARDLFLRFSRNLKQVKKEEMNVLFQKGYLVLQAP